MARDTKRMRGERPFVFTNLRKDQGLDQVVDFILREGMLAAAPGSSPRQIGSVGKALVHLRTKSGNNI